LPRGIERTYERFLFNEVRNRLWRLVQQFVKPNLRRIHAEATMLRPDSAVVRVDQWPAEVDELIAALEVGLDVDGPDTRVEAQQIAVELSGQNAAQFQKILRSTIGTEIFTSEPWLGDQLESFASQNVALVGKLKREAASDLQGIIQRGMKSGLRVEEITKEINKKIKAVGNRAKFIARDQIAKTNADIAQLRQENIGVTKYVWRTSRDERVRPSHKVMEGKTCIWSDQTSYLNTDGKKRKRSSLDPSGVELHPGKDYQCRCTAEPVLEDIIGPGF
jgi:SPP1 gp7 family putative phage head morphogenesis protein